MLALYGNKDDAVTLQELREYYRTICVLETQAHYALDNFITSGIYQLGCKLRHAAYTGDDVTMQVADVIKKVA